VRIVERSASTGREYRLQIESLAAREREARHAAGAGLRRSEVRRLGATPPGSRRAANLWMMRPSPRSRRNRAEYPSSVPEITG
jgi:hypothetical protein